MKVLIRTNAQLVHEGRWDLDYHLPPELIERYPPDGRTQVSEFARVSKEKRDPSQEPDTTFMYVDIASVDVEAGVVTNPQELSGEEAPSRARMVIHAYDVIVSTCRPTRGAIAVVPAELHGQICSTAFTVLRCKEGVNPFFLQYVLRLDSTLEQFRKFATGSSYPAILDSDVLKTQIPAASPKRQDAIAATAVAALSQWKHALEEANTNFRSALQQANDLLTDEREGVDDALGDAPARNGAVVSIAAIHEALAKLEKAPEPAPEAEQLGLPQLPV